MGSILNNRRSRPISLRFSAGFTIVELIIVISIIGILATITIVSYSNWKQSTNVAQLKSDLNGIIGALEDYRTFNNTYPTNINTLTTFTKSSGVVLSGGSSDGGKTYCVTSTNPLYPGLSYHVDNTHDIQSGVCSVAGQFTLTITAGTGGTVNVGGSYDAGTSQTVTATASQYYSFTSWTGTGCPAGSSGSVVMTSNKTCLANFAATPIADPSYRTVTADTIGANTTFSWDTAACVGNTARYQYRYTISPSGYDSGLVATASTSVAFTTSTEAQTYTVETQAQCYNTATSSNWSVIGPGAGSYFRPITQYALTINAGTGGVVNAGGLYDSGTSQTITATPNTYYSFSSWSGSAGCVGVASHTITMDAAKTCTANFTATTITPPTTPTVTPNTVGATTTWSWGAASCPGNTARYQYRYTISPSGYDSGLIAISTTSVAFTTSTEGQTYTVAVQAECYNAATASGMSTAGSGSYFRPITQYTLTINAGTGGTVNAGGLYNTGTVQTITATPSIYYSFSSWTGSTGCSGVASHTITMDAAKTCTANFTATSITPPATPTVTPNTVGATTTFSWGAASCPGNTARYQYRYTISPSGYDSGLVATASTSVAFTTSTEGQTYTVATQAECYNVATASGMSASGSSSYFRPITQYILTIIAGTGGTVNAGGTYNSGTNQTITATPNANYQFSSWSGSTGCSGVASHTITMDAAKTCTANFTIITYTLTIVAGTGGTVNTGGTYNSGTNQTITATPSTYYSFTSWTGSTGCSGVASHTITMNAVKTCTANFTAIPITAPATPVVTANTIGATTTWSWGAASCPGNTARYQYRYTISPSGYDSGLVTVAATSVAFTTSTTGQTYTVATQAQCYNTATSSSWSAAGTGSYFRPAAGGPIAVSVSGVVTGGNGQSYMGWGPDWWDDDINADLFFDFSLSPYVNGTITGASLNWSFDSIGAEGDGDSEQIWIEHDGSRIQQWNYYNEPTTSSGAGITTAATAHKGGTVTYHFDADPGDYYSGFWYVEMNVHNVQLNFTWTAS